MTKSRISTTRVLLGVLGASSQTSKILREWNRMLREEKIDGSMDRYPCTAVTLPERLSEMLHFDRRGYIIIPALHQPILPLMDILDTSAKKRGAVDTVVNNGGVLTGHWTNDDDALRQELWLSRTLLC